MEVPATCDSKRGFPTRRQFPLWRYISTRRDDEGRAKGMHNADLCDFSVRANAVPYVIALSEDRARANHARALNI